MYHLDLYVRQDKGSQQEVAKFVNPQRNFKKYNLDSDLFLSDYNKKYNINEIIDLINRYINSKDQNIKSKFIFVVLESSKDYSFNDGINPNDLVKRKNNIPNGIRLKTLFSVRYDYIENQWYILPEPNDGGRWASNFATNPYDKWKQSQSDLIKKYENGV